MSASVAAFFLLVWVGTTPTSTWTAGAAPVPSPPAAGSPAATAPPAGGQDDTPVPLGVMTFNIRTSSGNDGDNGWMHRRTLVAKTIERLAPDVAGLQEALDEQESGTFWLSSADGPTGVGWRRNVSRIFTWARFHHRESGRRFHVLNTHLTLRRGQRQIDSAERIAGRVAALPAGSAVVVTGDFNAIAEISETWLAATGRGLQDAWLLAGERIGPPRTSNDFRPPELANPGRIDWILVGGPVRVRSVETIIDHDDGRYPSDHYPVVAQLQLQP